jgi:hypothetical protein
MAAEKLNLTICQGSVFRLPFTYRDGDGFGVDLSSAELRMQIRTPNRDEPDPPLLSLVSGTSTVNGSTITILSTSVVGATAITDFGADGNVEATGAGFQETVTRVSGFDDNGNPTGLVDVVEDVAIPADLVTISGSTSNDGSYRIGSVVDPDNLVLSPEPTVEVAAGTIAVDRFGRFEVLITAEESDLWDFSSAEYDLEIVEDTTIPTQPVRLVQGKVRLDKQTTR